MHLSSCQGQHDWPTGGCFAPVSWHYNITIAVILCAQRVAAGSADLVTKLKHEEIRCMYMKFNIEKCLVRVYLFLLLLLLLHLWSFHIQEGHTVRGNDAAFRAQGHQHSASHAHPTSTPSHHTPTLPTPHPCHTHLLPPPTYPTPFHYQPTPPPPTTNPPHPLVFGVLLSLPSLPCPSAEEA